jgi:general L-amino acid transport system substrate-binding protein
VRKSNTLICNVLKQLVLQVAVISTFILPVHAGTLEDVRSSGVFQCGVDDVVPGFSAQKKDGRWSGLSVDFCRSVATAVIGNAAKVNFRD